MSGDDGAAGGRGDAVPGVRSPAAPRRPPDPACAPSFIVADFRRRGVDVTHVAWQPRGDVPCACCVVSAASGSRTIVLHDTWVPSPPPGSPAPP